MLYYSVIKFNLKNYLFIQYSQKQFCFSNSEITMRRSFVPARYHESYGNGPDIYLHRVLSRRKGLVEGAFIRKGPGGAGERVKAEPADEWASFIPASRRLTKPRRNYCETPSRLGEEVLKEKTGRRKGKGKKGLNGVKKEKKR